VDHHEGDEGEELVEEEVDHHEGDKGEELVEELLDHHEGYEGEELVEEELDHHDGGEGEGPHGQGVSYSTQECLCCRALVGVPVRKLFISLFNNRPRGCLHHLVSARSA